MDVLLIAVYNLTLPSPPISSHTSLFQPSLAFQSSVRGGDLHLATLQKKYLDLKLGIERGITISKMS